MGHTNSLKIVIAAAGRRAHYIEWFQQALRSQGLTGEVIALEYRGHSPSFGLAHRNVTTPAYNGPEYKTMMCQWFASERPDLFLCLNDYELQVLSDGLADELREFGCVVPVLEKRSQALIFDKYRMSKLLMERGIPTPATHLGSEAATLATASRADEKFIVKHRFGSGSAGLHLATTTDLEDAVDQSAATALGQDGKAASDTLNAVVIQQYLPGTEYGVDGVFSLDGTSTLLGVIARRTDHIVHGDPDVATTVETHPFEADMAALGELLMPSGSINVDFRRDAHGRPLVIDINPRLGGGYPYNHRAGADVPAALVRSVAGLDHVPELLDYEIGVTTARREEFTVISRESESPMSSCRNQSLPRT